MSDNFDDFVEDLQNQIFEETRAAYGDVAFQRWLKPRYMGGINSPDGYGRVTGSCGDTIPPEKLKKPGLLKRFLNWIAKGADKSNMGKASCPT